MLHCTASSKRWQAENQQTFIRLHLMFQFNELESLFCCLEALIPAWLIDVAFELHCSGNWCLVSRRQAAQSFACQSALFLALHPISSNNEKLEEFFDSFLVFDFESTKSCFGKSSPSEFRRLIVKLTTFRYIHIWLRLWKFMSETVWWWRLLACKVKNVYSNVTTN